MSLQEYRSAYEDIYSLASESSAYIICGSNWYVASRRLKSILKEIFKLTPKTIVDMGCGDGAYAILIARKGISYIGVDISRTNLKRTAEWGKRENLEKSIDLILCDISSLPLRSHSIENALCSEVLEHVMDFRQVLTEMARVVEGYAVVSVPCIGGFVIDTLTANKRAQQSTEQTKKTVSQGIYKGLMMMVKSGGAAHINFFTMGILKANLDAKGFAIKKLRGCGFNFPLLHNSSKYKHLTTAKAFGILEDLILGKLPIFSLAPFIYLGNANIIAVCETYSHQKEQKSLH